MVKNNQSIIFLRNTFFLSAIIICFSECDKTIPGNTTDSATLMQLKPIAAFIASSDSVVMGDTIKFTSTSQRQPTELFWNFPGGTPNISKDLSPIVTYNSVGKFDVFLKATNGFGVDSILNKNVVKAYYKTDFSKDLSQWKIKKNWSYSSSPNIIGNSGLLAYSVFLNGSTSTIDYATLQRSFTNLPNNSEIKFWYYIYSPGGILNVKANGILLGSISGYGKGFITYDFKGGANVDIEFEAILRQSQSIYISQLTIKPL